MITNKDVEDNTDDFSILSNFKKQDKLKIKNKLIKKYKNTMNDFLQKIKDEEKDLYNNSSKLSILLSKFKNYGSLNKKNKNKNNNNGFINKNNKLNNTLKDKRSTTTLNLKQNDINKFDKLKNEIYNNNMTKTFYPCFGKSKYSIPYINRIVYGEEHSIDPFEQLRKDLFFKVKREIKKSNSINKTIGKKGIWINGKEILNKIKNNNDELEENEKI